MMKSCFNCLSISKLVNRHQKWMIMGHIKKIWARLYEKISKILGFFLQSDLQNKSSVENHLNFAPIYQFTYQHIRQWIFHHSRAHPFFRIDFETLVIFWRFGYYIILDYVIGHDVIGQPDIISEISGLDLLNIENRFAIYSLHKK